MKTAGLQKTENKNQSMVSSLFKKNEDVAFAGTNESAFELTNGHAFNFGNIKVHNPGSALRIQPKLEINQSGDQYEQEADAMADKVMRMSDTEVAQNSYKSSVPTIQRKFAECEKENEEKKLQRKEINNLSPSVAPSIVHDVLNSSSGKPMDNATRSFMESRFNYDFSSVKIHDNNLGGESASSINALAYTSGNNVVFSNGKYSPDTKSGKRLIAHELTHIVQQNQNLNSNSVQTQKAPSNQKDSENANDDYVKAQTYLTDFFDNEDKILEDIFHNTTNAIHQFGIYSTVKDKEGAEPPMATIKAVLKLIPGAEPILEAIEMVEKNIPIGKEISGLVKKEEKKSEPEEVKGEELGKTVSVYTKHREAISQQRLKDRSYLEQSHSDPKNKGKLNQLIVSHLGPIKKYDADVISKFGLEYEYQLYKEYYLKNAWINHIPPSLFGRPYTSYKIMDVPDTAQKRILYLHKQLGHVAKVSIDTRFADYDKKPEYGELVKILLDWGVKLYWLRGYVSDKPEVLHTGTDLQQPYVGEKYKDVK